MGDWGWRVPFLIGCMIVPVIFVIRRSLEETPEFQARKHRPTLREIVRSIGQNFGIVIAGMALVVMTTVSFYLITAYTPTFGKAELHLSDLDALLVTVCIGLSNFFWLPVMGAVSDKIGRKPLLLAATILAILTAYPALSWLVANPSFSHLLIVELWLSFLYGSYNGAMVVALTEIMPVEVRTTGFSLAYSLATATFGGFTPAACTYLIHVLDNKAAPGIWLSGAAVLGLIATLVLFRGNRHELRTAQAAVVRRRLIDRHREQARSHRVCGDCTMCTLKPVGASLLAMRPAQTTHASDRRTNKNAPTKVGAFSCAANA